MSKTTRALADGFVAFTKERLYAGSKKPLPPAKYVGPGPATPNADGALPIADYERAGAQDQIEQIAVMAKPVIERFGEHEAKLVAAINDLVIKLRLLAAKVDGTAVKKQAAQTHTPSGKRFLRMVEPIETIQIVDANSLDGIVLDAHRRVRTAKRYH